MKNIFLTTVAALSLFLLAACDDSVRPTSDQTQRHQQEQLSEESNMKVGMPAVTNFFEKRLMKDIIEMRDNPKMNTFTYVTDMNGKLHKRCNSIGFGIPYATQYTNPQKIANWHETPGNTAVTIPQADPNGLFSPAAAEGTWVLCHDPKSDKLYPVYFEDRVTVSPFELDNN